MLSDFNNFFHCCRHKLSAHKHIIEFVTSPVVCCCTTLKNATRHTSSQKLLNKSAMHVVIPLSLQSRKFWCHLLLTSLLLLHDDNDVILLPAIRRVSDNDIIPAGQCTGTLHRTCATVELLRQEMPKFLASNLWPPNSPDFSPVDYEIWAVMQHRVYHRQIHIWNGSSSTSGAVLNS